jgi:hypothetical protein
MERIEDSASDCKIVTVCSRAALALSHDLFRRLLGGIEIQINSLGKIHCLFCAAGGAH